MSIIRSYQFTGSNCRELYRQVWLKLNTVLPRCLWVMTIKEFMHEKSLLPTLTITQENIVLDPLQVLRWDTRAFRCAGVLKVLLRVLQASLAASRNQLLRHLLDTAAADCKVTSDERDELRTALEAAQDSCVLQILLEACLESAEDRKTPGQLWALREVRSIICSYLHQVFISEPSLAKLVHFQGYPRELLPVTVKGIPSMHICLDFIPELMSQPSLEKQVFAIDLVSHLSLQYALPKSMSVARLAINTLSTLVTVLSSENRAELFVPSMPALVRICEAFPPLVDDVVSLLMQVGRICLAAACTNGSYQLANLTNWQAISIDDKSDQTAINNFLVGKIQQTFTNILKHAILKVKVY